MSKGKARGFTLIEMLIVIVVLLVVTAFAVYNAQTAMRDARVTAAYNQTLMTMRDTRQLAVDTRKTYILTFVAPQTMQIWRQDGGSPLPAPVLTNTYVLANDISFRNEPGIPTTAGSTPDGFGTGAYSPDFDQSAGGAGASIYFAPDGGAYDQTGNINNGVVYMARPGDLYSSRAISLFGLTSRMRGWRLYKNAVSGLNQWQPI